MRHFDAWILRDPYSIFHYYSTGRRWQESVRDMIQNRQICAPQVDMTESLDSSSSFSSSRKPVDPLGLSISSQPDCGFLQKLPPEIRAMIYKYVFGDEAVHLVQLKGKIRHVRCQNLSASIASHRNCCPETPARWRAASSNETNRLLYPHTHSRLSEKLSNSSLSLLRTCRAIYLEAADIPYSDLVFDVDDLHTFVAFSLSICPQRLRSIRRLTVQWTPIWQPMAGEDSSTSIYSHTHNDRLWALFWQRVQALTGLEELRISLDLGRFMGPTTITTTTTTTTNHPTTTAAGAPNTLLGGNKKISLATDEAWVTPMLGVRGLKAFDLCVTAKCDASAKNILAEEIGRDAVLLCDYLRSAMCSPREHRAQQQQQQPSDEQQHPSGMSCSMEGISNMFYNPSRLLITAA